jgi:hypothetical protein
VLSAALKVKKEAWAMQQRWCSATPEAEAVRLALRPLKRASNADAGRGSGRRLNPVMYKRLCERFLGKAPPLISVKAQDTPVHPG